MTAQSKTILFFVFLTIISIRLFGSDVVRKEYIKKINKEFPTTPNGEVNIFNKYGTVDIKSWNKNSVKIEVRIVVNARNQGDADDVFERIDINFNTRPGYVSAETSIASANSSSWWWLWNTNTSAEYQIHYLVYMPKTNTLKLETKYCDATMDYLSGGGDLQMKYGDFDSEGFGGNVSMYLSYGKGKIMTLKNLDGELSYGRLVLPTCHDVDLDSKYSKIKISKGGDLTINSKYDTYVLGDIRRMSVLGKYSDYTINQINDIHFDGKYSDMKIELLVNNGDFASKYGNIIITNIEDGFGLIELDGKYTDFKLGTEMTKAFCLEAESEYGDIIVPNNLQIKENVNEGNSQAVSAFLLNRSCGSRIFSIIKYGQLKIIH